MKDIMQIEDGIRNIVYNTSAFTLMHKIHNENPDKNVSSAALVKAQKHARKTISICEELGLNPEVVCDVQFNFIDYYPVSDKVSFV